MNCPRCLKPLQKDSLDAAGETVDALSCPKCTGHFIALKDLKKVQSVVDIHFLTWRNLPGAETQGRALFCPNCEGMKVMDKIVSERDQRVVMDVCHACDHVWLDRGEVEAMQQRGLLGAVAEMVRFLRNTP